MDHACVYMYITVCMFVYVNTCDRCHNRSYAYTGMYACVYTYMLCVCVHERRRSKKGQQGCRLIEAEMECNWTYAIRERKKKETASVAVYHAEQSCTTIKKEEMHSSATQCLASHSRDRSFARARVASHLYIIVGHSCRARTAKISLGSR